MRLPPEQVEHFYAIWKPLLLFVNRQLHVEPEMLDAKVDDRWDAQKAFPIREALWANDPIREAFIAENPAGLSPADLAIVESWRHRVADTFCVFRHLKKHSLLIRASPPEVYAVLGLTNSLDEVLLFTPCYAKAVLLPFEGQIIYDSLIVPYNVYLGPGIRRDLQETYRDAKERGAIITSLPPREPASREEEQAEAQEVDARVAEAFRRHLYRTGLSPKVVERDTAAVAAFGEWLAARPDPRSLRDFGPDEAGAYLAALPSEGRKEAQLKQTKTGLTRFLRFLRDTGRMDFDQAGAILDRLKGRDGG
jgi:hypothetical protein